MSIPANNTSRKAKSNFPLVVYVLIAANVLAFMASLSLQSYQIHDLALVPATLVEQPWTVVTSAFLHVGVLHLGMNMLALYIFGRPLVERYGNFNFLLVYVLSMLGSAAAIYFLSDPNSVTVGASGAIFGIAGYYFLRSGSLLGEGAIFLGINFVFAFNMPNISWQGHLGGFVIGALLGFLMRTQNSLVSKKPKPTIPQ